MKILEKIQKFDDAETRHVIAPSARDSKLLIYLIPIIFTRKVCYPIIVPFYPNCKYLTKCTSDFSNLISNMS